MEGPRPTLEEINQQAYMNRREFLTVLATAAFTLVNGLPTATEAHAQGTDDPQPPTLLQLIQRWFNRSDSDNSASVDLVKPQNPPAELKKDPNRREDNLRMGNNFLDLDKVQVIPNTGANTIIEVIPNR